MSAETLASTASRLRMYVAVATFLAILIGAAQANGAITGINVAEKPDRVVISVQGDCALRMSPFTSSAGRYLGFQFTSRLVAKGRMVGIHGGGIYNVRYGNFRSHPPITRVVVNTTRHPDYSTSWSDDKRRVEISVLKFGVKPVSAAKPLSKVKALVQQVGRGPEASEPAPEVPETPAPDVKTTTPAQPETASAAAEPAAEPPKAQPAPELVEVAAAPVQAAPEAAPEPARNVVVASTELVFPSATPATTSEKSGILSPSNEAKPAQVARVNSGFFGALASSGDPKVSVNFLNADINDVLKALSVQSGHNVVASKDVTGNVTVSLNRVGMDEAMDYVAKLSGYAYVQDNGTYLVAAKDKLGALVDTKADESAVEIVSLAYINVDEVLALLKAQYPDVQASKVTRAAKSDVAGLKLDPALTGQTDNALVLLGGRTQVEAAKGLISKLDESMKSRAMEEIQAIYRVKHVSVPELAKTLMVLVPGIRIALAPSEGFRLSAPQGVMIDDSGSKLMQAASDDKMTAQAQRNSSDAGSKGSNSSTQYSGEIPSDTKSQALVIVGREADVQKATAMAATLDTKSPQVKIDAKITSINENGEKQIGLKWDWDTISFSETAVNAWARNGVGFAATLQALIEDGSAELLASPSLVCLEGKPGVFWVGDEVTYISSVSAAINGQATYETATAKAGVQLRVVASVSDDDYVTLNLHPEVSTLSLTQVGSVSLPTVNRRFTDHTLRVKNGQTIVIGGLIRNDEVETMSKVPGLSSIPLFGHLFRHKAKTTEHTEVVMFITATVLTD